VLFAETNAPQDSLSGDPNIHVGEGKTQTTRKGDRKKPERISRGRKQGSRIEGIQSYDENRKTFSKR